MKKISAILFALFLTTTALHAQSNPAGIEATGIRLTRTGANVTVQFTLGAGPRVVKPGESLVVEPVLIHDAREHRLPPVVIRGKRSRILDARHELAGRREYESLPLYIAPGESTEYTAIVPHEDWMNGAQLVFEGASVSCGPSMEVELGPIVDNILDTLQGVEIRIVEVPVEGPKTTGERLAVRYPFIAPAPEFEEIGWESAAATATTATAATTGQRLSADQHMIEAARAGSISVFFAQGSHTIDCNVDANNTNLVELISAMRMLSAARDVEISKIVIAGFASPEGSVSFNEKLAYRRAMAVSDFLVDNSDTDPRKIQIYNGGVNWPGLRRLIQQSDIHHRERLIEIIDTMPVWNAAEGRGRLGELMRVDGGRPYRQMVRDFFPELRQAAYIKVYFNNR